MKNKLIVFFLFILLYSGCVSEYHPTGIEEISGMLVVEGIIEEGETIIKLRRSVGLTEDFGDDNVYDALVYIENSKEYRSASGVYDWQKGGYVIGGVSFEEGAEYRVNITVGMDQYVSEFLAPLRTPGITGINALKRGPGEVVQICVNTEDPEDKSRYYFWSYEEAWEYRARLLAEVGEALDGSGGLVSYSFYTANNTYNCWGDDYPTAFILDNTEKYSSNKVVNKILTTLVPSNEKLSVLYYVKVKQHQIRKEAYDFYYNLQKNVDNGNSIFGSMPMEVKGNITNLTRPDEVVIGYVEVSSRSVAEQYFPSSDGLYEDPGKNCPVTDDPDEYEGLVLYRIDDGGAYYAPKTCVDCRTGYRATKNKPDFWPTSSL